MLDDSQPGYRETGSDWTTVASTGDLAGEHRELAATQGLATAVWRFDGLADGRYVAGVK